MLPSSAMASAPPSSAVVKQGCVGGPGLTDSAGLFAHGGFTSAAVEAKSRQERRGQVDLLHTAERARDDAARLRFLSPLAEAVLIESRDIPLGLDVDLLNRGGAADVAEVNPRPRLDQARGTETGFCQGIAKRHIEAGRVRRREQLLRVGSRAVLEPGQDAMQARRARVRARPGALTNRQLTRARLQIPRPSSAAVTRRHRSPPSSPAAATWKNQDTARGEGGESAPPACSMLGVTASGHRAAPWSRCGSYG